jgi:dihydroorotate dehydrogenase
MIVANTTISRPGVARHALAGEAGGLSGAALFPLATTMLAHTFLRVEGRFPLVGVGGIGGAADALAKIEAGATLLQLYSALVFQGPALIGAILRGLSRAVEPGGAGSLAAMVGGAAKERARDFIPAG